VPGHDSLASAGTSGAVPFVVIAPTGGVDAVDAVRRQRARGVRRWRPDRGTTSGVVSNNFFFSCPSRVFLPAPAGGQRRSSVHVSRPCPFSLRRDSTAGKVSLRGSVRGHSSGSPRVRWTTRRARFRGSRIRHWVAGGTAARPSSGRFQTRGVRTDLARRAALRWKNPAREAIPEAR
jgi:hypothetical protein